MSRYYPAYYYFNTSAGLHRTEHADGSFNLTVNIGTCKTMFTIISTKPCNNTVLFSGRGKTLVTVTALCPAFSKVVDQYPVVLHQKLAKLLIDSCNTSCRVIYFQDGKYPRNHLINEVFSAFFFLTYSDYGILVSKSLCSLHYT